MNHLKRPFKSDLGMGKFSGVYLFVLIVIVFGVWIPDTFLTRSTLYSVASQQAVSGLIALAVLVPIAAGSFDLSVGANANLCGVLAVLLQVQEHWGIAAAIVFSIATGVLVGAVNALVVVKLRVNSFIATLAMGSILAAVLIIVTGNVQPTPVVSSAWTNLTQASVAGFQVVILYLLGAALLVWWLLEHTPAGRYIYATGGNAEAARLSGVRVGRWTAVSLIVSGGISGLAGILYINLTGPSLSFGSALLLPAFTAVFLGSTQLKPGKFNVWGTILAIYVLATGVEGLQLASGQQWLSDMFNGVALIVAVALAASRLNGRTGSRRAWRNSRVLTRRASVVIDRTASPDAATDDIPTVLH